MHRTRTPLSLAALCLMAFGLMAPALAQNPAKVAAGPTEAPFSLTAADGTGLALVGLDARAVIDGPLAFTELRLVFENPNNRTIEGHFKVTMPDDAAISRFAMKIRGAWMEGEVVEKQAARRAYEDALHRRQDPALLEQDGGNIFRARVFPIQGRERKELIIAWSHELTTAGEAYRLPLAGLPSIESMKLTALTSAATAGGPKTSLGGQNSRYQITTVEKQNFTPDQDWVVYGGDIPASGDALRNGELAVVRFTAPPASGDVGLTGAVILFDTSASRAIGFDARLAGLKALVAKLPDIGIQSVTVIAFDQFSERIYEGAPAGFGQKHIDRLKERGALGASSLQVGLEAAAFTEGAGRRLIIVGDGVVTAGETERDALKTQAAALTGRGITRIDAIVDTSARDGALLEQLVTADGLMPGKVIEGRNPIEQQLDRLRKLALADVQIAVDGAKWIWPERVRGLQGGDAVLAFVELPAGAPLRVKLSGGVDRVVEPATRQAEQPLLERAWVKARIERLENLRAKSDPDLKEALKQQIITLSTRHRVLSTYTALVVLETENDYRRFGIARNALADILTVGPTGLEVMQRKGQALAVATPPPPPPRRVRDRNRRAERERRDARPRAKRRSRAPGAPSGGAPEADDSIAMDSLDEGALADKDAESGGDGFAGGAPATATATPAPPPTEAAAPEPEMARASAAPMDEAKSEEAPRRARRMRPRPRPSSGVAVAAEEAEARPDPFPARQPVQVAKPTGESQGRRELREIEKGRPALTGEMAQIDKALARGKVKRALKSARAWRAKDATDLLALVALGRSYAMAGNGIEAARAFGSVVDLYPSRADMRRFAGNWLERLGRVGLEMAADTYRKALAQRPDHPSIYHLLGLTLARLGQYDEAMRVVLDGITARRVNGRFAEVERILAEDAQIIGAVWAAAEPARRDEIRSRLASKSLKIDGRATTRFVLTWETDANDVDFHIFDEDYNHAFYSRRGLATGGNLYADITTGYGPECFTIYDADAFPYRLKAHYYSRGPMGHGAGKVQIIRHDGKGGLGVEDRPFVIMQDGAYVDLGKVTAKDAKPGKPGAVQIAK